MAETFYVVPEEKHNALVTAAYLARGFTQEEGNAAAVFAAYATKHGIRTHNAIKALHLDHLFGSGAGGCTPGAQLEKSPARFSASEVWNANRKLGQATAYEAIDRAMELADQHGIAQISVDNAFHYLWGGGYVMYAAQKGYIAYTNCTAALAEVVPFGGKHPTLGTNPHSWGFPTTEAVGFPIVIDWATSVVSMGRVQQFAREGASLPSDAAVDAEGNPTTDATKARALLPFGGHKGYGLSLINEIMGAFIGGSLPTLRSRWPGYMEVGSVQEGREVPGAGEKYTPCFYFQVIHPDAISSGAYANNRGRAQNLKAVIDDILGHGNGACLLPGQMEAEFARKTEAAGGLLFSKAELASLDEVAEEAGSGKIDRGDLATTT